VEHLKLFSTFATATLPQLTVAEFLSGGSYDRHLRRVRTIYARQCAQMAEAVARHFPSGTRVTSPAGGFLVWIELPQHINALQLYHRALQAGVTFAPGPIFSAKGAYQNYLRLNAAVWSDSVAQAVTRLGELACAG
jgi:DNA-binding transcriptional MocR family regulator